jgi:hypothetical protein
LANPAIDISNLRQLLKRCKNEEKESVFASMVDRHPEDIMLLELLSGNPPILLLDSLMELKDYSRDNI